MAGWRARSTVRTSLVPSTTGWESVTPVTDATPTSSSSSAPDAQVVRSPRRSPHGSGDAEDVRRGAPMYDEDPVLHVAGAAGVGALAFTGSQSLLFAVVALVAIASGLLLLRAAAALRRGSDTHA